MRERLEVAAYWLERENAGENQIVKDRIFERIRISSLLRVRRYIDP
jgi:hypothetical protein